MYRKLLLGLVFPFIANFSYAEVPAPSPSVRSLVLTLAPEKQGMELCYRMAELVERITLRKRYSPAFTHLNKDFTEAMDSFKLSQLFSNSQFVAHTIQGKKGKKLTFFAQTQADQFIYDVNQDSYETIPLRRLGDLAQNVWMAYNEESSSEKTEDSYTFSIKGFINLDQINIRTLENLADGIPLLLQKALNQSHGVHAKVQEIALQEWQEVFPQTFAFLNRYLLPDFTFASKENGLVSVQLSFLVQEENFKRDFPSMHTYIKRLSEIVSWQGHWSTEKGLQLISIRTIPDKMGLQFNFFLRHGRLVAKGSGSLEETWQLTGLAAMKSQLHSDTYIHFRGLSITLNKLVVGFNYRLLDQGAELESRLVKLPPPIVAGRAFYIIPTWWIDMSIPGDIETLAKNFTGALLAANRGDGTWLKLELQERGEYNRLRNAVSTEIIDNYFIRLATQLAKRQLFPSEDENLEIDHFVIRAMAALKQDLRLPSAIDSLDRTRTR